MRATTLTVALASISAALAAPIASIPSGYKWTLDQWTGDWYGVGWANFYMIAPSATAGDVVIPALSFTDRCTNVAGSGGQTFNCNEKIKDNDGTRTIEFTLLPFDQSLQEVQLDTVYRFKSGGSTYEVTGRLSHGHANTPVTFTVSPQGPTKVA